MYRDLVSWTADRRSVGIGHRLRVSQWLHRSIVLLAGALLSGCSHMAAPTDPLAFTFDFTGGPHGFIADFADYPPEHAEVYELTADYRAISPPLDSRSGLFILRYQPERRSVHGLQGISRRPDTRRTICGHGQDGDSNRHAKRLFRRWRLAGRERLDQGWR